MAQQKQNVLVADIGGTHARLGITALSPQAVPEPIQAFKVMNCADYPNMGALLDAYLATLPPPLNADTARQACMAVAGPIREENPGQTGSITNTGWQVDSEALAQRFNWNHVSLLNDFGALAYSVPYLPATEMVRIQTGQPASRGPMSVIGPGTGFGVALLVPETRPDNEQRWQVITTEGGHSSFAPTSRREAQLCDYLSGFERHLSVENVVSGSGIATIYNALAALSGDAGGADADAEHAPAPHEISQRALAGDDALCVETMSLFCEILGSIAGNIALLHGATGGVYLGGGILPKIQSLLMTSRFFERFSHKGVMSAYVERLPVYLIDSPHAALLGAAYWYSQRAMPSD